MPSVFPASVEQILEAIPNTTCVKCHGLGRWRTKRRCTLCNGSGSTAEVLDRCTACNGRGQLPDAAAERVECPLCVGFGVVFVECWQCSRQGFTEESDEYCKYCHGVGRISFAQRVAESAESRYVQYLVDCVGECAQKNSREDLTKASAIDLLLREVQVFARSLEPRRDLELFPQNLRLSLGDARLALSQALRKRSEQEQHERVALEKEARVASRRVLDGIRAAQEDLYDKYWQGWDAIE